MFHMAERHAGLLPNDANAWARDRMDVCRAQHGGTADARTRNSQAAVTTHQGHQPHRVITRSGGGGMDTEQVFGTPTEGVPA